VGRVHPSPHISLNGLAVLAHWSCPQAPGWMVQRGDIFPETGGLGQTSLMFLVHPTITPEQMASYAEVVRTLLMRAPR